MKMQSVYTNPRLLLSTENNKKNICDAIKDEWLDADAIGEIVGVSRSRASVLCRLLGEEGYVEYVEKQMIKDGKNGRQRRFYKAIKEYIPKDIQLKDPATLVRPQQYYGTGVMFNPWEPKLPEGTLREVKLFNEKDNDYFHAPLKKRGAISIGSTFSLYDGATL
jgi:hypothetical protein